MIAEAPVYDSARRTSPLIEEAVAVWRYRDLVIQLARRDLVTRYKRSTLGAAWTMLQPLGMMAILSVAFSQVFRSTPAYAAFVLINLVAWQFFAQTTVAAMRQLIWGGSLIQKIYIPKTTFAFAAVAWGLANLVLSLIPLIAVTLVSGLPIRPAVLFVPVAIVLLAAFALGVGLILSTLAAYYPDVAEIYEIGLTAWMWATPIVYPEEILSAGVRWWILNFNPAYHVIKVFRVPFYNGIVPAPERIAAACLVAFVTLAVGWFVFTRKADEFAYRI